MGGLAFALGVTTLQEVDHGWFCRSDLMRGRVSEFGWVSRLDLVTLNRRIPRLCAGSALVLKVLMLVLLFVLVLILILVLLIVLVLRCVSLLRQTRTSINARAFPVA